MDFEFREEEIVRTVPLELADELQHAPLGNLRGSASSSEATALVKYLAQKYPRVTQAAGPTKRTNRVGKRAADFERAIGAFLADLLAAQTAHDGAGWLRLSLNKSDFTGQSVKQRVFEGVRTAWRNAGLVEEVKGYPRNLKFGSPGPMRGQLTRFRATRLLLDTCGGFPPEERVTLSLNEPGSLPRTVPYGRAVPLGGLWGTCGGTWSTWVPFRLGPLFSKYAATDFKTVRVKPLLLLGCAPMRPPRKDVRRFSRRDCEASGREYRSD
jgi:hypothetical protein